MPIKGLTCDMNIYRQFLAETENMCNRQSRRELSVSLSTTMHDTLCTSHNLAWLGILKGVFTSSMHQPNPVLALLPKSTRYVDSCGPTIPTSASRKLGVFR